MNAREYRERLIDEVKKFPVLYDTRHENHRDIDVRDRCWTDIADRLGANCEVLKREWKILRDSLRQSIKKNKRGATTKAGTPCKSWRFQSRMAFVLPYMTRRSQRQVIMKADVKEDVEGEGRTGGAGEPSDAEEWEACGAGGGTEGEEADALELFFASVCASARRLPAPHQSRLKRRVLDALLSAEEQYDAERAAGAGAGAGAAPPLNPTY